MSKLILASGSPRRRELLARLSIPFEIVVPATDEQQIEGESPGAHVRRLSRAKALEVAARHQGVTVLGADTIVWFQDRILGKPHTVEAAAGMLRSLAGNRHQVYTGVALLIPGRDRPRIVPRSVKTNVRFDRLSPDRIARYAASGEPLDKAGGYAIQGLAAAFVKEVRGSVTNVIGLPLALVYEMLSEAGLVKS